MLYNKITGSVVRFIHYFQKVQGSNLANDILKYQMLIKQIYYNRFWGDVGTSITNRNLSINKSFTNRLLYIEINIFATEHNYLSLKHFTNKK